MAKGKLTSKGFEKLGDILGDVALVIFANIILQVFKGDAVTSRSLIITLVALFIGLWFLVLSILFVNYSDVLSKKD